MVNGQTVTKTIIACEIEFVIDVADNDKPVETIVLKNWTVVVYPNPTTDGILNINITGDDIPRGAMMQVFSANGNLIRTLTNLSSTNTININSQPSGAYTLRIVFDRENVVALKVIKE